MRPNGQATMCDDSGEMLSEAVDSVCWFGRPVSAANKSGNDGVAPRGRTTFPRTLWTRATYRG